MLVLLAALSASTPRLPERASTQKQQITGPQQLHNLKEGSGTHKNNRDTQRGERGMEKQTRTDAKSGDETRVPPTRQHIANHQHSVHARRNREQRRHTNKDKDL